MTFLLDSGAKLAHEPPALEDFEHARHATSSSKQKGSASPKVLRHPPLGPASGYLQAGNGLEVYNTVGGETSPPGRKPLKEQQNPEEIFMNEFAAMHKMAGQDFDKVTSTLNRRLQRTNKPFDMYGLYRAVTSRGGFVERALARRHLSMVEVFREMKNHYEGHTFTDIGTLLLNSYEKYFLPYEQAHPQDIEERVFMNGREGQGKERRVSSDVDVECLLDGDNVGCAKGAKNQGQKPKAKNVLKRTNNKDVESKHTAVDSDEPKRRRVSEKLEDSDYRVQGLSNGPALVDFATLGYDVEQSVIEAAAAMVAAETAERKWIQEGYNTGKLTGLTSYDYRHSQLSQQNYEQQQQPTMMTLSQMPAPQSFAPHRLSVSSSARDMYSGGAEGAQTVGVAPMDDANVLRDPLVGVAPAEDDYFVDRLELKTLRGSPMGFNPGDATFGSSRALLRPSQGGLNGEAAAGTEEEAVLGALPGGNPMSFHFMSCHPMSRAYTSSPRAYTSSPRANTSSPGPFGQSDSVGDMADAGFWTSVMERLTPEC